MRRFELNMCGLAWRRLALPGWLAVIGLFAGSGWAQSATNDNFANPTVITGAWGTIGGCNTNATGETGEPNHSGFVPTYSIWYKWTAPADGEVSMDTFGSHCLATNTSFVLTNITIGTNTYTNVYVMVTNVYAGPLDTILAVYSGPDINHLTQVAANDDLSPYLLQKEQYMSRGGISDLPFGGPSGLRFNAVSNTTYYVALDSKGATTVNSSGGGSIFGGSLVSAPNGFPALNWAYHSSGVFRFASEQFDWQNATGPIPMYYCTPYEDYPDWNSDYKTYYTYFPTGLVVSVTRLAGASGRALVDYATVDGTAMADFDYMPVSGTLAFDDFEMSKEITVPILMGRFGDDFMFPPKPGLDFSVVLSNARLDPAESLEVSPPRLDLTWSNATVRVLNYDLVMDGTTNRDVYNFSKVHYRYPTDINTYYTTVLLTVYRTFYQSAPPEGATLHYRVNSMYLDDINPEGWDNFFPLEPGCDYATPTPPDEASIHGTNSDFVLANGDISFGANDGWKTISFTITNDGLTKFARNFKVCIWRDAESGGGIVPVGAADECFVTILYNDQNPPAGSVDELHNPDHSYDMALPFVPFSDPDDMDQPGADGQVMGMVVFPNSYVVTNMVGTNTVVVTNVLDQAIIVGDFHSFNSYARNRIARVNADGSLDHLYLAPPLDGADAFISSVAAAPNGKILIGGGFVAFSGQQSQGVALLNSDGSLDTADFNPGLGADAPVRAVLVMPNGEFLIAGDFTFYNGASCSHVALLNPNGTLDTSFVAPTITGNTINALALYNGKIYIGGDFAAVGGRGLNNLARLNANGSLDLAYANTLGVGVDGTVHALSIDARGRLLAGGDFLTVAGLSCSRIARFTTGGSLDATFEAGTGADATVFTILPQGDGTIYAAGGFTSFNGTHRLGITRLFPDGTVDTTFLDTAYNQFAGLHRRRFIDPAGAVYAAGVQSDGKVLIGGSFQQVGGGQANAAIRIDPNDFFGPYNQNLYAEPKTRAGLRNRSNFARLIGGATPGPGNLSLTYPSYSVVKSAASATISLTRTNGTLGYLSANLSVPSGVAQSGVDYSYSGSVPTYLTAWRLYDYLPASPPAALTRCFSDGLFGFSASPTDIYGSTFFAYTPNRVVISVIRNNTPGDRSASIRLSNPSCADQFYLGGQTLPISGALGPSVAPFTIVDDNHNPGVFGFAAPVFTVNENAGSALINVIRTNGAYGNVSLKYATTATGNAAVGQDYWPTNGTLLFPAGVTNASFAVPIINNTDIQPQDRIVGLNLSLLSIGTFGLTNASLYIIDDDYPIGYVNFSQSSYTTNESAGAVVLTVNRSGGTRGAISVICATTNTATAQPGTNYVSVSTNLFWDSGDSSNRYVVVPLIHDNLVGPNTTFQVRLSNPVAYGTNAPTMLGGSRVSATVTIVDDDHYGHLAFSAPTYFVNENGGYATITAIRTGGAAQTLTVNFATADGTAVSTGPESYRNFGATNGTLTFAPGQISASFTVPVYDDGYVDPANFFFTVSLSNLSPPEAGFGYPTTAQVNILDAEAINQPPGLPDPNFPSVPGFNGDVLSVAFQTDGQILAAGAFTSVNGAGRGHIARLNPDSSLDPTFLNLMTGANGVINQLLLQTDGRIVVGGAFTLLNGVGRNHIARLLSDGSIDSSFSPSSGADGNVFALAETFPPGGTNRSLLVGGRFTHLNGVSLSSFARLNDDGSLDSNFTPLLNPGSTVYGLAVYPTNVPHAGQILIGGDFTAVNGVSRNGLARLNPDSSLDLTFNPGLGVTNAVRALALQSDGSILVGGSFTSFDGQPLNHIARLSPDGALDSSFTANIGPGADDTVDAILIQPDNRIVLVGAFTHANGVSRGHITRLLPDGNVDPTINFGYGADSFINTVALQPSGMFVLGGGFSTFDHQPRSHIARVFGGAMVGSGALTFTSPAFQADENSTNALITVRRTGGTAGAVSIDFATADGTATNGVNYSNVLSTLTFPSGETFQSVLVPVMEDLQITPDLTVNLSLSHPQGGAVLGDQYVATLLVLNDDSAVSFTSTNYTVKQDIPTGLAGVTLVRQGSTRFPATVDFFTITNGTAILGRDYQAVSNTVAFLTGQSKVTVSVPILNDPLMLNDTTVVLQMTNASNTLLFNPSTAFLTILSTNASPGQFAFAQTNYVVGEADGVVALTILRTNGHTGPVTVNFATFSGTNAGAAVPDVNYASTNGVLAFADGELSKTIYVPILQDHVVRGNVSFSVVLSNPSRGATILAPTAAAVTILDADQGVGFRDGISVTNETAAAIILIVERVVTNGLTTVQYATADGTALSNVNYRASSGTLNFVDGESAKSLSIPLLRDPRVTGSLSFRVNLANPSAPAVLWPYASALVNLLDADTGLSFTNATFGILKNGTNVTISVTRSNANTGLVTVNFATANGTALANVDYYPTNGLLTFSNGIAFQSFAVPIINNRLLEGDRTFGVYLSTNAASLGGARLLTPSTASVIITDDIAGLSFSSPAYEVKENGGQAVIGVLRTGYTNCSVTVDFATVSGTNSDAGVPGVNYSPTNGTLLFTNGEILKSFAIPVTDDSRVDGDHTVLVSLSNPATTNSPVGFAVLTATNAATLTILEADGSEVLSAGAALTFTRSFTNATPVSLATATGTGSPYPSVITVSNLYSQVEKVAVRVPNASAPAAQDLAALLLGPSGAGALLMANAGGANPLPGVSLAFDDYAASPLPHEAAITNGVYAPAAYAPVPAFPGAPAPPYGTNFAAFVDSSPNGNWSLYVLDETPPFAGSLSNGWAIDLTCLETNAARLIQPGETVTMLFAFRNGAGFDVTNLIAALLPTNGVSNPSPPQTYGPLPVKGPSVSRLFTFTPLGTNGQQIAATFQLFDGTRPLNNLVFNFVLGTSTTTFSNTAPITINDYPTNASPYPSTINVSLVGNLVTKTTVTLTNLNHTWPSDINVLLVSPTGQKSYLMSKCGGSYTIAKVTLTFDDSAAAPLPPGAQILSGTYRPSAYPLAPPPFPLPAPPPPYLTNLAVFNGINPNNLWSLYVYYDTPRNFGIISNGWLLNLTTATPIPPAADLGLAMTASADSVIVTSNLTFTVNLLNYGPGVASNTVVSDILPDGAVYVSSSVSQGQVSTNGAGSLTWNAGTLLKGAQAALVLTVQPGLLGTATNSASVSTGTSDLNPADDTAAAGAYVVAPTADLALGLVSAPNSLPLGNTYTLTATVTNLGPASAPGLVVILYLDPAANLVSASPPGWTFDNLNNIITFANLGIPGSNSLLSASVVVRPTAPSMTYTTFATCYSDVTDPFKANNDNSVKTVVLPPLVVGVQTPSPNSLVLTWPANLGFYNVQFATNLTPPVAWTTLTNPPPAIVNGQYTFTNSIGAGKMFFRLTGATP